MSQEPAGPELTRQAISKHLTFLQPPTPMGPVTTAVLDDTCGNLVQLVAG